MHARPDAAHRRGRAALASLAALAALAAALPAGVPAAVRAQAPPSPQDAAEADTVDGPADPAAEVDPFVGTAPGDADYGTGGGAGNTFPGADVPFGMVQWSPDTVGRQPGGYLYADDRIRGFSLTHFSGAGCSGYGDVPFLPFAGTVTTSPATDPARYTARFSHEHEVAEPGYYRVDLDDGPRVELTVTRRAGVGRFTFPAGRPQSVLVDVSGSANGTRDARVTVGTDTVSGWAESGNFCGSGNRYRVHFTARFSRPFASSGTWKDGAVRSGATRVRGGSAPRWARGDTPTELRRRAAGPAPGRGSGAWVTFDPTGGPQVTVRVGLSFVDVAGAGRNLRAEVGRAGFDRVRAAARAEWNRRLGAIRIGGGTPGERTTFYTALYHALLAPNVFSDVDGRYAGVDGRVHRAAPGHAQYANFSGWDVYRSQVQLLALLAPAEASDVARSLLNQAGQAGGAWDRWTQANGYTGVMVGDPYQSIVASLYAFGARDFDARAALASMVRGATRPTTTGYVERPGLRAYLSSGYVPMGERDVWGPAATTLEYTTADFGVAALAGALGEHRVRAEFMRRAQYWQNLFNPATGYLQPRRRDGSFLTLFRPAAMTGYVEGNGAQYTWMVPYDARGLFDAMGGDRAVVRRLDRFFRVLNAGPRRDAAFLGNEPTLQAPWMYAFAGAPYRTQAVVRRALTTLYRPTPGGYVGNDDLGQVSSWYVWAAIGMYPQIPGRAELVLASPLFPRVTVRRPSGVTITVNAPGARADRPYVRRLLVDGSTWQRAWLPASFVATGGTLDVTVSSTPDTSWAADPRAAPPSFRDGESPVLTFANPDRAVLPPGGRATVAVGAVGVTGTARSMAWVAHPPQGLSVSPRSGRLTVPARGRGQVRLALRARPGARTGFAALPVTLTGGGLSRRVTVTVVVGRPGGLPASYDNVGVSDDADHGDADYDDGGSAYSLQALAAAGVRPGGTVTAAGLTFRWPDCGSGQPDNAVADGQTVLVPTVPGRGTRVLSLLGSATHGPSRGTLTLLFADGGRMRVAVGFSDWTLGGGRARPSFGNVVAARMPYRNVADGSRERVPTLLFATAPIALPPGRVLRAVRLPEATDRGDLHVFALAVGPAAP
jgi:predicted alpha-1,2-mannosidase